ncbi:hypothetical protein [Streptomyces sp. NBC_01803]|uniref:hypothetical protein n=1 Tax=Streptomyces sp. NBC_01803 TaxID=2975946 RepID=UPI002DDBFD7B|nr:hypothetical protein [Streptomyces sp. NBC_01803]WSA45407.1 hypothetical protein OIE51_15055 [Streptomyces sp. NBC_01803]
MAHNPQAPQQGPQDFDPAGSTQMFKAFVNDDAQTRRSAPATPAATSTGPRVGVIAGVVLALLVVVAVAWLALA